MALNSNSEKPVFRTGGSNLEEQEHQSSILRLVEIIGSKANLSVTKTGDRLGAAFQHFAAATCSHSAMGRDGDETLGPLILSLCTDPECWPASRRLMRYYPN